MKTRRSVLASATALAVALVLASGGAGGAGAATKKKAVKTKTPTTTKVVIANGKPCKSKGTQATASGGSFECVQLISGALQWWQAGTIRNPIKIGVPVRLASELSGTWEVTVTGRTDNDTARVLAVDPRNALVDPTATISSVNLTIKNLGTAANRTRFVGYNGVTRTRAAVERWTNGASLEEDCWFNETVEPGDTKTCSFPYELSNDEVPQLRLGLIVDFAPEPDRVHEHRQGPAAAQVDDARLRIGFTFPSAEGKSEPNRRADQWGLLVGVVVAQRVVPPLIGRGTRVRVFKDAVHRTHRGQAFSATRAELRHDDHVDAMVEDGPEMGWTVA